MIDYSFTENALQILEGRRHQSERDLETRRQHLYKKLPRLRQIDMELASHGLSIARSVLSTDQDMDLLLQNLQDTNKALQSERETILNSAGLSGSDLTLHHHCSMCKDTGYVNGKICQCLDYLRRTLAYQSLCQDFPLDSMTFESFKVDYYSQGEERDYMQKIYSFCKDYASDFSPRHASSLYFCGGTGLGKTHLSLAIVGSVTEAGYQAIYGSWQGFVSLMEEQKFTAGMSMEATHQALTFCDLLVLDDVGSEFVTAFDIACLYQVLNTRINRGLPTIISSNLPPEQLITLYNERIASRIRGFYDVFPFHGKDNRLKRFR